MKKVYTCGYMDDGENCRTFAGGEDVTPGDALMAAQLWLDALLRFHEEAGERKEKEELKFIINGYMELSPEMRKKAIEMCVLLNRSRK